MTDAAAVNGLAAPADGPTRPAAAGLARAAGVWIGIALLLAILLGGYDLARDLRLARSAAATSGQIVTLAPDRQAAEYTYTVEGAKYKTEVHSDWSGRPYQALQVGDAITVFYARDAPDNSSTLPPGELLLDRMLSVAALAGVCATALTLGLWKRIA